MVELEGRGDGARDGRLHGVQVASAQLLLPSLSPVAVPGIVVLLLSLQGDWGAILSMDCTRLGWSEALLAAGDVSITSSSSASVFSSVSRVQASSPVRNLVLKIPMSRLTPRQRKSLDYNERLCELESKHEYININFHLN